MLINKYDLIGVYPRMRGEPNAARGCFVQNSMHWPEGQC